MSMAVAGDHSGLSRLSAAAEDYSLSNDDKTRRKPACTACRSIKMKCLPPGGSPPGSRCTRCIRLNLACEYLKPLPPGRKPKSSLVFQQHPTPPRVLADLPLPPPPARRDSAQTVASSPATMHHSPPTFRQQPIYSASSPGLAQHGSSLNGSPASDAGANRHSISGPVEAAERRAHTNQPQQPLDLPAQSPDPIDLLVLGTVEAQRLFDQFFAELNPCIKLLDRQLHTVVSLRRTVLLAAILAVSSKFYRSDLYPTLLAEAQRQVGRGMAECQGGIELVQAICLLVFWKSPNDGTGWLKVGFAVRLAYSLRLHVRRVAPLPPDEWEARAILDRERTWFNLTCFERTCRNYLDADEQGLYIANMTGTLNGFDLDQWLLDSSVFGCPEDRLLLLSVAIGNVRTICEAMRPLRSQPAAKGLFDHANQMLAETWEKYLPHPPDFGSDENASRAYLQQKAAWLWMNQSVHASYLAVAGVEDSTALALWIAATAEIVEHSVKVAQSGLMAKMQDAPGKLLFKLAESFVKLFPILSHITQTTIMEWLTAVYSACGEAKEGDESSVAAYIQRFYRVVIRSLSFSTSMPSTRPASPRPATTLADSTNQNGQGSAYINPFESVLGSSVNQLVPELQQANFDPLTFDPLAGMPTVDGSYWESVLPGFTTNGWQWLYDGQATQ